MPSIAPPGGPAADPCAAAPAAADHAPTPPPTDDLLVVEALWHEPVHLSRVTALALSSDGATLFSGCAAAAPKAAPAAEAPLAARGAADGAPAPAFAPPAAAATARRLVPLPGGAALLCLAADGALRCHAAADGTVLWAAALPGTPAARALAGGKAAANPPGAKAGAASTAAAAASAAAAAAAGPEFLPSAGYRGARAGYLFRAGARGAGYYRADVVAALAPATPAVGAAGNGESVEAAAARRAAARAHLLATAAADPGLRCAAFAHDLSAVYAPAPEAPADVALWRLEGADSTGAPARATRAGALRGHARPVLSLAPSHDGALLYSGSYDATARVWSLAARTCLAVLSGHGGGVRALAPSADGRALFTAGADNTLRAWRAGAWVCARALAGRHEDASWPCVAALHEPRAGRGGGGTDGDGAEPDAPAVLVSGSTGLFGGATLKAFRPRDGACAATFAHLAFDARGDVSALAVSPDGRAVFSGASDGSVAAWALRWGAAPPPAGLRRGFL
jgi:hypothetical protein